MMPAAAEVRRLVLYSGLAPQERSLRGSKRSDVTLPRSAPEHLSTGFPGRYDVLERGSKMPSLKLAIFDPTPMGRGPHRAELIGHRICSTVKRRRCRRPMSVATEISKSRQ